MAGSLNVEKGKSWQDFYGPDSSKYLGQAWLGICGTSCHKVCHTVTG